MSVGFRRGEGRRPWRSRRLLCALCAPLRLCQLCTRAVSGVTAQLPDFGGARGAEDAGEGLPDRASAATLALMIMTMIVKLC